LPRFRSPLRRPAFEGVFTILFVAIAPSLGADQAVAEPTNTIRDLVQALTRCWRAPPGSVGSELTVGLMLTRTGELFGKPQITYSKLMGDAPAQRRFVNSVLASLASCLPVKMTETLGQAVAGRRLTIRFSSRPRERGAALEALTASSAPIAWVQ